MSAKRPPSSFHADARGDDANPPPWWRVGIMWLVVGGPLLVIVAGIVTWVMAVHWPDPVVYEQAYRQGRLTPALLGRNHAATQVPAPAAPSSQPEVPR